MMTFEGLVHVMVGRQHAESVKGELGSLSDLGTSFGHCAPSYTAAYNKTNTQHHIAYCTYVLVVPLVLLYKLFSFSEQLNYFYSTLSLINLQSLNLKNI